MDTDTAWEYLYNLIWSKQVLIFITLKGDGEQHLSQSVSVTFPPNPDDESMYPAGSKDNSHGFTAWWIPGFQGAIAVIVTLSLVNRVSKLFRFVHLSRSNLWYAHKSRKKCRKNQKPCAESNPRHHQSYGRRAGSVGHIIVYLCEDQPLFEIFTFIYSSFTGILRTHNMTSSQLAW